MASIGWIGAPLAPQALEVTFTGQSLQEWPRQTGSAKSETLAVTEKQMAEIREAWDHVIDAKLIEWGRNPNDLADESLIPPTPVAIQVASTLAYKLRAGGYAPPIRAVPDGDGGVVFDRWDHDVSESFEISKNGVIELVVLRNHKVISRGLVQLS